MTIQIEKILKTISVRLRYLPDICLEIYNFSAYILYIIYTYYILYYAVPAFT